jgi:hypothetical protein
MNATVAASWVAVAGTLGGVAVGGGLDWARSARAERRAAADRRDEAFAAVVEVCAWLRLEADSDRRRVRGESLEITAAYFEALEPRIRELVSQVMLLTVRLSMVDDEAIAAAAGRVMQAAPKVLAHFDESGEAYAQRVNELDAALGQAASPGRGCGAMVEAQAAATDGSP